MILGNQILLPQQEKFVYYSYGLSPTRTFAGYGVSTLAETTGNFGRCLYVASKQSYSYAYFIPPVPARFNTLRLIFEPLVTASSGSWPYLECGSQRTKIVLSNPGAMYYVDLDIHQEGDEYALISFRYGTSSDLALAVYRLYAF